LNLAAWRNLTGLNCEVSAKALLVSIVDTLQRRLLLYNVPTSYVLYKVHANTKEKIRSLFFKYDVAKFEGFRV
jgi:hypothetical protein